MCALYNETMFLDVAQLQVGYPDRARPLVDAVSFGLHAGEVGVLIGPWGCGKSTLLRAVAGLERVTAGVCDVLLRADDIVHDDDAPVKAEILRKSFRGSEILYTLRLKTGETVMAHVPSHHDHKVGEWIGIRAGVDHVLTFNRACPVNHHELCSMPCAAHATSAAQEHLLQQQEKP